MTDKFTPKRDRNVSTASHTLDHRKEEKFVLLIDALRELSNSMVHVRNAQLDQDQMIGEGNALIELELSDSMPSSRVKRNQRSK